jgi:hypothetical protein
VCVGEMNKLRLGEGAKGRAPYPLPQTPTPKPLKGREGGGGMSNVLEGAREIGPLPEPTLNPLSR